jgi:hypothetical protein
MSAPAPYIKKTNRRSPFSNRNRKIGASQRKRNEKGLVSFSGEMKAELYAHVHRIMEWEGIKQAKAISFLLELGIESYAVMLARMDGTLPEGSPTFAPDSKHVIAPVREAVVEEAAEVMLLKLQQIAENEAYEDCDG